MALTTPSDFQLVSELIETGYTETVTQNVEAFGAASNGALTINTVAFQGETPQANYFKEIASLVSRRINDGTGSDGSATSLQLTEGADTAARLARRIGPVDITMGALRARNFTPEQASLAVGRQIAKAELANQLNSALSSLVGALAGTTGALFDNTATGITTNTLTHEALVEGLNLFGDANSDIVAWVMHSKAYFDLVKQAIDPSAAPETIGAATIYGGGPGTFGKPVIVTDSSALTTGSTDYYVGGLRAGALQIAVDTMPALVQDIVTGNENLTVRIQGELDYIARVMGYAYDQSAGGDNPTDATLATTSNWALEASSVKQGAGFLVLVD